MIVIIASLSSLSIAFINSSIVIITLIIIITIYLVIIVIIVVYASFSSFAVVHTISADASAGDCGVACRTAMPHNTRKYLSSLRSVITPVIPSITRHLYLAG